jgi:RNA polymerase sigma factor (sigma-70 family)
MRKIQLTKQAIYAESKSTALYLRDISKIQFEQSNSINIESFCSREQFERHLVHTHLKFAAQVAIRYGGMGLDKEDLISIANIGLIKASKLFDPNYGVKFISFSVNYIRAEITKSLNELSRTVRIPSHKINQINYASFSLDQEFENDDNSTSYGDRYVRCEMNESGFDATFVKAEIKKALNFLHPNSRIAIQMYYAIGYEYEYSMEDIANVIGVSTERVRQIIRKAEIQLKASFLRYL